MHGEPRPIHYAGGDLDRANTHRHDPAWLAAMRIHPAARVVPVWRDKNLVLGLNEEKSEGDRRVGADRAAPDSSHRDQQPRAGWLTGERYAVLAAVERDTWTLLGLDDEGPIFAADVSEIEGERLSALAGEGAFVDLRQVGTLASGSDLAIMAYARGMLAWHRRNRFCSTCGSATSIQQGGAMRRCDNPACGAETFPRIDPAVIMLVERIPASGAPRQCLLARHRRLPPRAFSTLAGYVEPGETLEEAVAREVLEETGVRVSRVTYQGSQPWPFPASLMIGFRALADSSEIIIDPHELDEACWFSADEIAAFGEWGDDSASFRLPRKDSIARALVDAWLADVRRP
jgi:NAD+ diphosphatase